MQKPIIDNSFTELRSEQNTSCNWTGSADFGRIVPFHIEELVGTEKVVTCRPRIELQMLPLASPTFGKIDIYVHYFYVPFRLIWEDFNDVMDRQGVGKNATPPYFRPFDFATFYASLSSSSKRAFYKHWTSMGLPPFFADSNYTGATDANQRDHLTILKFRAYQQIWWDFYRDPELLRDESKANYIITKSGLWRTVGADAAANQNIVAPKIRSIKDCWLANLFTSPGYSPSGLKPFESYPDELNDALGIDTSEITGVGDFVQDVYFEDDTPVNSKGDSSVLLRKIEALTRLSERLSLGGKRAIDAMFAAYGIKPDFMKLNMAEYVGGAKSSVLISDITASADTIVSTELGSTGSPLGQKVGAGYAQLNDLNINYTAREPGYLFGVFSIMPHVHFTQGLDKSWFRNSVYDWFTKSLERTGQVAVSKKEVAMRSTWNTGISRDEDDNTFAFTQPYYEYKRGQDILAGDMAYYHNVDDGNKQTQYMESMEMYVDFKTDRDYDADNLLVDKYNFNKVFFYLGGSLWNDVDDHFHVCIDKEVIKNSPMDGYAVPTIETTAEPHKTTGNIGGDTVL